MVDVPQPAAHEFMNTVDTRSRNLPGQRSSSTSSFTSAASNHHEPLSCNTVSSHSQRTDKLLESVLEPRNFSSESFARRLPPPNIPLHNPHPPLLRDTSTSPTMPTPESAAFLAKKPKVPPTFDGVDYDDTKALKAAQDSIIREQWVKVMMGRLVREELSKCYYTNGVNHLEKCGHLRERYLELLKDAKVKGYLFEQQNQTPAKNQ